MEVTRESILKAIELIDKNPELLKGRTSSTYDLIYNNKQYPPILILSEANKLNGGGELFLSDFGNNVDIPFKIIRDYGFKIIQKSTNLNNREQFKSWVLKNLTENSGAGPAYITSIDWLSERFYEKNKISKKSIFEIEDVKLITELHKEVKKIQRDKKSFIYNKNAPSYGERYFYSASLSKYIEFLLEKQSEMVLVNNDFNKSPKSFDIGTYNEFNFNSGLIYSDRLISRFVSSLLAKPFVILSGLSGSGKTKIAQSFVQWICEDEKQYNIVPVGADWTNREPLVGYPNGLVAVEYITPDSGVLNLLINANNDESKPYFLILDEMNLSHVERYFADFLSIMESKDTIKLYTGNERKSLDGTSIPFEIGWPKNLFIIGTVNIDETTYMFSPKVLDRANVIEFRITVDEIESFLSNPGIPDLSKLLKQGVEMAESFLSISNKADVEKNEKLTKELVNFFNELMKVGAEFGYRSATEIMQLVTKLKMLEPSITDDECLDIAIMQKLLPKLHGSRSKLVKILIALAGLCIEGMKKEDFEKNFEDLYKKDFEDINVKYPISFEKLIRMYKNVLANGFTSYAEA
jgi:5-methylcytosine-specific restriction protein B